MKYSVKISIEANSPDEAKRTGQLLQNIADSTDNNTKDFLYSKISQNANYFAAIADKLKNPVIQKIIG
jgi:hypothetical protein